MLKTIETHGKINVFELMMLLKVFGGSLGLVIDALWGLFGDSWGTLGVIKMGEGRAHAKLFVSEAVSERVETGVV